MSTISSVKTKSMSFSVKADTFNVLTDYCKERGISKSYFMSEALENYLRECLEDKEDYEAAATAWNEYEKSGEKGYSADEVRKELGL